MKAGVIMLCALWLAVAAYAGYRLTARSFAWIDRPASGAPAAIVRPQEAPSAPAPSTAKIDIEAMKDKTPAQLMEQAKHLSPQQLLCLRSAITPVHLQAAIQGTLQPKDLTLQESAAVNACLN